MRPIPVATLAVLALLATACGGSTDPLGSLADSSDADVLSPCAPPGDTTTTTLVEPTGQRPPLGEMEAALADNPDAQFVVDDSVAGGMSREDAVHAMYGQVVGDELLATARSLPGFVTGAYARPEQGEPFELSFSGQEVPDGLDPGAFDLASYGLEVTTGASGFDQQAFSAAYEAAAEVGMRVLGGSGDEVAGTATIEVISATPAQVAQWEEAVGEAAATTCLVRATPSEPCDDEVVADARSRAETEADPVVARYLGLTLAEAQAQADAEDRPLRPVVEDGVPLATTDDLVPGRLNVTVCQDVVIDLTIESD